METSTLLLIGLIIILFFVYDYWCHQHWKRLGIETPPYLPILGHFHYFSKGLAGAFVEFQKNVGKVYGLYTFRKPTLVIDDPDILKEILVRNFSSFHDRRPSPTKEAPLDKALTQLTGIRWKRVRNTVSPAFSANKLKLMSGLINRCADNLIANLQAQVDAGTNTEMKAIYECMTMDTIACCAFGLDINSQKTPNHPFVQKAKALFKINFKDPKIILVFILPFTRHIFNKLNIGLMDSSVINYFINIVNTTIDMRSKEEKTRSDILQLMMDAHKHQDDEQEAEGEEEIQDEDMTSDVNEEKIYKEPLTEDEIIAQSVAFFLGGYEFSNVALTFVSYCLAVNPEFQDKLIEEVDKFCPERDDVTYEMVNKMPYLDQIFCETMRMYSPAVIADRRCNETITVKGVTIPAGTDIFYTIHRIHYDPEYYEEPEKFIPERFTKEKKEKRNPYTYLPFGAGPRNCIAQRFAIFQVKMAIVRVLQNFKFEPCAETEIPPPPGRSSVAPDKGITLHVIPRK